MSSVQEPHLHLEVGHILLAPTPTGSAEIVSDGFPHVFK
jgi:hypothetical protein